MTSRLSVRFNLAAHRKPSLAMAIAFLLLVGSYSQETNPDESWFSGWTKNRDCFASGEDRGTDLGATTKNSCEAACVEADSGTGGCCFRHSGQKTCHYKPQASGFVTLPREKPRNADNRAILIKGENTWVQWTDLGGSSEGRECKRSMDIQTQIGTQTSDGWDQFHEGCQDYCANNGYEYASFKPINSAEQCRCYDNCKPLNVGSSYTQYKVWQQVSYVDTSGYRLSTSSSSFVSSSSDDGEASGCYDADGVPCLPSQSTQNRRLMFEGVVAEDTCICK